MADIYRIPLSNIPQRFDISLNGRALTISSRWLETTGWAIDIIDAITTDCLIACLPLVAGCDLLEQFQHLGLGGKLMVYTDGLPEDVPTLDNLGVESNLYFMVSQ